MERGLQEFRIRGVKTNIPFLINLVTHPKFVAGGFTTKFIDETPELFDFSARRDRATKLFTYLAKVIVNGNPLVKKRPAKVRHEPAPVPELDHKRPIPTAHGKSCWRWGPSDSASGSSNRSHY